MNWSVATIEEIQEQLPNRIPNYLEYKMRSLSRALRLEPSENITPKNLNEIKSYVEDSLDYARRLVEDPDVLETIDSLDESWSKLYKQFLILSVSVSSLYYRSKEEIETMLRKKNENIGRSDTSHV